MKLFRIVVLALAAVSLVSCYDKGEDNSYSVYSATVTFRLQEDGSYYLKQDDSTALLVLNPTLKDCPFKKEMRALVQYLYDEKEQSGNVVEGYKHTFDVTIATIDTMSMSKPVPYVEGVDKDKEFGNEPVGLYLDANLFPRTMVEDGYLNVFFAFYYFLYNAPHSFTLVSGVNPDDPYELEFRHNSFGDGEGSSAYQLAAFSLKDLPDTEGKTVKLTLKWRSLVNNEMASTQFDYCSRKDW